MCCDTERKGNKIQILRPWKACGVNYDKTCYNYVYIVVKDDQDKELTSIFVQPDRNVVLYSDDCGRVRACYAVYGKLFVREKPSSVIPRNAATGAKLAGIFSESLKSGINKALETQIESLAGSLCPAVAAGLVTGLSGLLVGLCASSSLSGLSTKKDTTQRCKMVKKVMNKTLDDKFAELASGVIDTLKYSLYKNYRVQRLSGPVDFSQVGVLGYTREKIEERRQHLFDMLQNYHQTIIDINVEFDFTDPEQCLVGLPSYMAIAMIRLALCQELAWVDPYSSTPEHSGYKESVKVLAFKYSYTISEAWNKVKEARRKAIYIKSKPTLKLQAPISVWRTLCDDFKESVEVLCLDEQSPMNYIPDIDYIKSLYEKVEMESLAYSYGYPDTIVENIRTLITDQIPYDYIKQGDLLSKIVNMKLKQNTPISKQVRTKGHKT